MEVFRFDPEIAMTIKDGSFNLKLGQLLGSATLEHADILFLEADIRYNPPDSEVQQLFAVTTGLCIVEAGELAPFVLGAYQAVVAEPHEQWTASTTEPVVALFLEGSFDVWAVAVTKEIVVVPYDQSWPDSFDQIRQSLEPIVERVALRIDHVGSTAVPGLAAKPVIDIDIVASSQSDVTALIEGLRSAGYRWRGDLGVTGREAFSLTQESELPEHHLYVVVENNRAHLDHLLLRDVLREDHQAREDYATLKTSNVKVAGRNMDIYVAAKAGFVASLLTRARRDRGLPPVEYWIP